MKTKSSYPAKGKQHDNSMRQLELLLGGMHPSQVFKRYFVERLTPDPVEMEIAPPGQLFSEISEGKVKITFAVGLLLGRYFDPRRVLWLVDYQALYDRQMDPFWEQFRSEQFNAREREWALIRRKSKQLCAKLLKQFRAKGDR